MSSIVLKIPATTANLGLGFDSIGLALTKYLTIRAEKSVNWQFQFEEDFLKVLPVNEENLVAKVAIEVAKRYEQVMPSLKITMASDIPLTHGLGSSSSAIVAGVELANQFCRLHLTESEKIQLATEIEGHPDNVGPCVTGGLFIGAYTQEQLFYEKLSFDNIGIILSIPPYELSTAAVRKVLPQEYSRLAMVNQNAWGHLMVVALIKGDYQKMGAFMMKDLIHEPYRQPLIKEFKKVKETALTNGAYATVISGAGPTILTLCPNEQVQSILEALTVQIPNCQHQSVAVEPHGIRYC